MAAAAAAAAPAGLSHATLLGLAALGAGKGGAAQKAIIERVMELAPAADMSDERNVQAADLAALRDAVDKARTRRRPRLLLGPLRRGRPLADARSRATSDDTRARTPRTGERGVGGGHAKCPRPRTPWGV